MNHFMDKVVYQIYPRSFNDSNNDGFGDLKGITQKLDYLKSLNVDYLWITPFFVSPQRDNGYDIEDYYNIDPLFGTMQDFEELVSKASSMGIGIMLDMVFNHTSTNHEWFRKALAGDKEYQDYYIFKDGLCDVYPTNWVSKFGGPAWEYVKDLGKWYLHLFDVTQADLNWNNKKVREELKKIILFWKNKGVSGFRFDVINLISKPECFKDDYDGDGRRFYTDGPRVHEFLQELVKDTGIDDMITVGEMSSTSLHNCIKYSNPDEKELTMCFNFHHLKVDYKNGDKWSICPVDKKALKDLFKTWQEGMQLGNGWNALFFTNHDQPRTISRFGDEDKYYKESGKMLAALIHLMRGTPYIYQGEEIGMLNTHFTDISQYRDVESRNYYNILLNEGKSERESLEIINARSRDNCRTPMQWDDSIYAGFSEVTPWIEVPKFGKAINVSSQIDDDTSILAFYKKLTKLRKEMDIISKGSIQFLFDDNENVIGYERLLDNKKLLVICNLIKNDVCLQYDESEKTDILYNNDFSKKNDDCLQCDIRDRKDNLNNDDFCTDKDGWLHLNGKKGRVILSNYDDFNIINNKITLRPYEFIAIYFNEFNTSN